MSELIKAYSDELNSVYDQIEALWHKAYNSEDNGDYLTDEFHKKLKELYDRKAALKALINDLNKEKTFDFEI